MIIKNPSKRPISGILLLNKPEGLSSNQALQKVKRLFNAKKAGHTGSLDPLATGMLPICFGEASKFSQYLLDADKLYLAEAQLGIAMDTGDSTGNMIASNPNVNVPLSALVQVCEEMLGVSEQIPPMYSALKYKGQPLYKLARQGIDIERKPRIISIKQIELQSYKGDIFSFLVRCSKGTYIRTLIEDIASKLGHYAHMTSLHRIATAGFESESMFEYEQLDAMTEGDRDSCLLPCDFAVTHFPSINIDEKGIIKLQQGRAIDFEDCEQDSIYRLYHDDQFCGLVTCPVPGQLAALRLMAVKS